MDNHGWPGHEGWDGTCFACGYFEIDPPALAVDPALKEDDEADALCAVHRGRMTEGLCVVCGRREMWVTVTSESYIGACRECLVEKKGEAFVKTIELSHSQGGRPG